MLELRTQSRVTRRRDVVLEGPGRGPLLAHLFRIEVIIRFVGEAVVHTLRFQQYAPV